jgi:WD40 repeat protein
MLAFIGSDRKVGLFDTKTHKLLPAPLDLAGIMSSQSTPLAWSRDSTKLAYIGPNDKIFIWDVRTRSKVLELRGYSSPITSIGISSDGKSLVSGGTDGTVRLWDLDSGSVLGTLLLLTDQRWLSISPGGHYGGSDNIEGVLRYVVLPDGGTTTETLSPKEFATKYQWKNNPSRVRLADR